MFKLQINADWLNVKTFAQALYKWMPILSPSDKHEEIVEKIELYLTTGVAMVWVVDPDLRTVAVHRPDTAPVLFNVLQELTAEPHLPGFRVPVAEFFPQ